MKRTERLRRVGVLLATRERGARRAMALANDDLRRATVGVQAVLDQCERVGRTGGTGATTLEPTLPVAATAAIVEAGLREATERIAARDAAKEMAAERRQAWREATSRREAVERLVDRWEEEGRIDRQKRVDDELDDVINARVSRTGPIRIEEDPQ